MSKTPLVRVAVWAGIGFFVFFGGWSFIAPRSFFDVVAPWEPYNAHLFHDAGAFSVGIGAGLFVSLFKPRIAALAGAAVGAVLHAIAHIVDYGDGGRPTDPYFLSGLALLLVAALVKVWNADDADRVDGENS